MNKHLLFLLSFLCVLQLNAQQLTGSQLLEKAIQFHDPKGNWATFSGTLFVEMTTPNNPKRESEITIDLPKEFFSVTAKRAKHTTSYTIAKDSCTIQFNGKTRFTDEETKQYGLTCDRALLYKNYYTYLYGLPMKLKDAGTKIDQKVVTKTFKGKTYLVLQVRYDESVGSDSWCFYFDPKTYAMEVYQFLKNGVPNSGEYILLSGLETIQGIQMPKNRAWYYNKDDGYLGTDSLSIH